MKKINYLFTLCAFLFGFTSSAQESIDWLTDAKLAGTNFTESLLLGHEATAQGGAALNAANYNTGVGFYTLQDISTGDYNVAIGWKALWNLKSASWNVAMGREAGKQITNGTYNTIIGNASGGMIISGVGNTLLGSGANVTANNSNNQIVIGKGATGIADHHVTLGNNSTVGVYFSQDRQAIAYGGAIDLNPADSGDQDVAEITLENDETISNGTDGTVVISGNLSVSSDMRLKDNITSLGSTISDIIKLDGKSYTREGRKEIGLLAQDVELVYPELVSIDRKGILAVNYQALSAVLINGMKDQEARIAKLELLVKLLLNNK